MIELLIFMQNKMKRNIVKKVNWKPGSKFISNKTECSSNIDHRSNIINGNNEQASDSPCATEESSIIMFNAFDASISEVETSKDVEVSLRTHAFISENKSMACEKEKEKCITSSFKSNIQKINLYSHRNQEENVFRDNKKSTNSEFFSSRSINKDIKSKRFTLEYICTKKLVDAEAPNQLQNEEPEDEECNIESSSHNYSQLERSKCVSNLPRQSIGEIKSIDAIK